MKIIIIMGLRSISASKDVIGDPSRPGTNNSELYWSKDERKSDASLLVTLLAVVGVMVDI